MADHDWYSLDFGWSTRLLWPCVVRRFEVSVLKHPHDVETPCFKLQSITTESPPQSHRQFHIDLRWLDCPA